MKTLRRVPCELELLEFFSAEPVEGNLSEGWANYKAQDSDNVRLCFGYSIYTGGIFTSVEIGNRTIFSFNQEGEGEIAIAEKTLLCRMSADGGERTLIIKVEPFISVIWS